MNAAIVKPASFKAAQSRLATYYNNFIASSRTYFAWGKVLTMILPFQHILSTFNAITQI